MGHTRTEVHAPVQGIIAIDPDEESFIVGIPKFFVIVYSIFGIVGFIYFDNYEKRRDMDILLFG
ncbi:hypothetical protein [Levilactobacillus suantsaii]|uniref:Uncharacterized protein n=1 Tax=Levilactobacillus suantsaii TaxID=2292255 RepID=A0A4V1LF56_9LACO|nr:hypothetical protein [Levilactobacillus suantsaii]QMU08248.1 hypothetical protein H3M12_00775 [Levilactobacillus suantsaii]RXI76567.1 hypothetical protein DXH47_10470 [Levilactobacillus suantsaii]